MTKFVLFAVCFALVVAQPGGGPPGGGAPPGGTGSALAGATTASSCPSSVTTCAAGGSSNYNAWSSNISFDGNGRTAVSFVTNNCPSKSSSMKYSGVAGPSASASCYSVSLPVSTYNSLSALAAPLRSVVGYTLAGANIYGPMDAGFTSGQVCAGTCSAGGFLGTDLAVCSASLEYQCGTSAVNTKMFLDDCGGHASPYHYHWDLKCEYDATSSAAGHSPLIGIGLDGRGLFGQFEATSNTLPTLDACGGHFGPTPASWFLDSAGKNITVAAQANAYHYHIVAGGPNTIACYGPVNSFTAAMSLYSTCGTGFETICTSRGVNVYDIDCPVFNQQGNGATYNLNYTVTAACPYCYGNCMVPSSSTVSSSTGSASSMASSGSSSSSTGSSGSSSLSSSGSSASSGSVSTNSTKSAASSITSHAAAGYLLVVGAMVSVISLLF